MAFSYICELYDLNALMKKLVLLLALMAASLFTASHAQAQRVGIKTNLLYDATTTINLGVEVGVAKKLTLDLSGNLNLWDWKNNMKWKHWMVQPELRFWTCQRFNGHFFGVHALAAEYNVGNLPIPRNLTFLGMDIGSLATTRYEGWAFGAGLAYGYALPLSKHWNLEGEIGLGAVYSISDSFGCNACDRSLAQNQRRIMPMLTKAAISIVYLF